MTKENNDLMIRLTHAEKKALRMLAAFGEISMTEHIRREAIYDLWEKYFPDVPLGSNPITYVKKVKGE